MSLTIARLQIKRLEIIKLTPVVAVEYGFSTRKAHRSNFPTTAVKEVNIAKPFLNSTNSLLPMSSTIDKPTIH